MGAVAEITAASSGPASAASGPGSLCALGRFCGPALSRAFRCTGVLTSMRGAGKAVRASRMSAGKKGRLRCTGQPCSRGISTLHSRPYICWAGTVATSAGGPCMSKRCAMRSATPAKLRQRLGRAFGAPVLPEVWAMTATASGFTATACPSSPAAASTAAASTTIAGRSCSESATMAVPGYSRSRSARVWLSRAGGSSVGSWRRPAASRPPAKAARSSHRFNTDLAAIRCDASRWLAARRRPRLTGASASRYKAVAAGPCSSCIRRICADHCASGRSDTPAARGAAGDGSATCGSRTPPGIPPAPPGS